MEVHRKRKYTPLLHLFLLPSIFSQLVAASLYLYAKGAQNNAAEDGVAKNAIKDIALSMDFAGIDLIEELHHDKGVKDDGVMLRGRRMQGSIAATVDVKYNLSCR